MSDPVRGPIWVTTLDLAAPLRDLTAPPRDDGHVYVAARVLTRLHGQPLGELDLPLHGGIISGAAVAALARQELGDALRRHLEDDGLDASAEPTVDSLPVTGDPPCAWPARFARLGVPPPFITIVVATCRRPERLARTLRKLAAQTYASCEVLVVDNCPDVPGAQTAVEALQDGRFRALVEPATGVSHARNRGLQEARGEIVLFADDDVDVDHDWAGNLTVPFYEDADVACVTGLILPARLDSDGEQLFEQFGGFSKGYAPRTYTIDEPDLGGLYPYNAGRFGSGANCAFRREVLSALGGFPLALGSGTLARGGEDLDAYLSVLLAGHKLRYEPSAIIWHELQQEPGMLAQHVYDYGIGVSAMITKRVLASPDERRAVLRALPAAARYVLAGDSPKNAAKTRHYPKRLTAYELAGLAYGPVAYLRSRRQQRRRAAARS